MGLAAQVRGQNGNRNPNPGWNGGPRNPGDNLYSDSVVALDADTGQLKWHYQFTPNDEFDWDAVQVPVLADLEWQGRPRKAMLWANRNGFFYVLDRVTGQFLLGKAFVRQNWNLGFEESGRPIRAPRARPSAEGTYIEPGTQGGTNWYSPSFSPRTGLFYVSVWDNYSVISTKAEVAPWSERRKYTGRAPPARGSASRPAAAPFRTEAEGYGAVRAIDPKTGEKKWDFRMVGHQFVAVSADAALYVFGLPD
jgi:alcohol dehydrogenase (cytochrome c)